MLSVHVRSTRIAFASEIEYGQVDERRSHVPPRCGTRGWLEESISLRRGFFLSQRRRCRRIVTKIFAEGRPCGFELRIRGGPKRRDTER